MTYPQAIDYLYTKLPMFSRIGSAAFKHDLTNTIALCAHIGNPQETFKTIHIAGTNGKGSVSHMLAAVLQTAGYKTGLYTSPHLRDFRERIKVNGEMIAEEKVVRFTERMQPMIEKTEPSFFELTVAMAFDHFASEKVDVAVIETGLGGRLDSTNIITPVLSVITNIGWDHMNMLGNTLPLIAGEKAGIIKPGVPVVIGEEQPETLPVFLNSASEKNAPISIASRKRQAVDWHWEKHHLWVSVAEEHHTDHKNFELDLPGIYQAKNLLTVLEAVFQLQQMGWSVPEEALHKGLKQAKKITGLHGRWEIIHTLPLVVLDVAHNEDGIKQLVQQIELTPHRGLHIITGMVKDKEVDRALRLLPQSATYYFTKAQIPRALPEQELKAKAAAAGLEGSVWPEVNAALQAALAQAGAEDLIVICGSVFLAGEVNTSIHSALPKHT